MEKGVPFTKEQIQDLAQQHPTPFYIYDEAGIRASMQALTKAFFWNKGFKEYFAVKATPNPTILAVLKEEGAGADASSLPELLLAERVGIVGEGIMFTSNDTSVEEFQEARRLGAIINLDDVAHLDFLEKRVGLPELLSFRYNPGGSRGNSIIGTGESAKFGIPHDQLFAAYAEAKRKGVKRFGLHAMLASNELDYSSFVETARVLFDLVVELREVTGIVLEFVNMGGGLGIPYRPSDTKLDLEKLSAGIRTVYEERNLAPLALSMENGRYLTGPHGYLVATVRHIKDTYKKYAGLDASMADLMRPGMYGAYHHISVLGGEGKEETNTYDVTGSLCENNDKFAIDRRLPELSPGDVLVIHDAGAHGQAMGFNYNGKLRPAEFLLSEGKFSMIRRAETTEDYFATLSF